MITAWKFYCFDLISKSNLSNYHAFDYKNIESERIISEQGHMLNKLCFR